MTNKKIKPGTVKVIEGRKHVWSGSKWVEQMGFWKPQKTKTINGEDYRLVNGKWVKSYGYNPTGFGQRTSPATHTTTNTKKPTTKKPVATKKPTTKKPVTTAKKPATKNPVPTTPRTRVASGQPKPKPKANTAEIAKLRKRIKTGGMAMQRGQLKGRLERRIRKLGG